MAFKPVCRGSETDFRCITPGAGVSTGRNLSVTIFTQTIYWLAKWVDNPTNQGIPAGTSMILPVRRTESPSRISVKSPKMMIPTSVVSSFGPSRMSHFQRSTTHHSWHFQDHEHGQSVTNVGYNTCLE